MIILLSQLILSILAVLSDTVMLALIAMVAGIVTSLIAPVVMFILKERADSKARKFDREERIALAKITQDRLEEVKLEGVKREDRITKQVNDVKKVAIVGVKNARHAYKEANGVNSKIAALGQKLAEDKHQHDIDLQTQQAINLRYEMDSQPQEHDVDLSHHDNVSDEVQEH